jgi:hypothetical protein
MTAWERTSEWNRRPATGSQRVAAMGNRNISPGLALARRGVQLPDSMALGASVFAGVGQNGRECGLSGRALRPAKCLHRMVDLNTVGLTAPDVILEEAVAINDFGQVVVNASNGHAYRIDLPGLLP